MTMFAGTARLSRCVGMRPTSRPPVRAARVGWFWGAVLLGFTATAAEELTPTSSDALSEIVVTAQKREERAQDVGIAITALGANEIKNLGIRDTTDVANSVPSVQFNRYSESAVVLNIRGVAQNDYGDQQEPPIASYQDDSYASSLNLAGFPVFDLQRIEVLRGPQGTLFGRNATGGALQFVSNKPTKNLEGDFTVTGGSYGELDFEGALSGPLTDAAQGRIAVLSNNHAAYLSNIAPGGDDRGSLRQLAVRGELALQPMDGLDALVTLRYAHDGPDTDAALYSFVPTYLDPVSGTGVFLTPTSPNPNPWGTCVGCDETGYRNDAINPYLGGDPWTIHSYGNVRLNRTITGASLHLDGHIGAVDITSASDFQHLSKAYSEQDFGNDGLPVIQFVQNNDLSQFTQELRASGTSDLNNWVGGVYFMRIVGHYSGQYAEPYFDYYPYTSFTQGTTSAAVFGQDEVTVADGWKLIGGLRYWHDKRSLNYEVYDNGDAYPVTDPILFNPNLYPGVADKVFQNWSAKLELERQFSRDLMVYLSFNRGTKSGGFEASLATPFPGLESAFIASIPYGTERLNAYELGIKSTWLDEKLRANADVFWYDYAGFQGYEQLGEVQAVKNLNAHEWGAELELEAHPLAGLTLSGSLSTLHSVLYDVTEPSLITVNTHLPQTPHWSLNGLVRYEHAVPGGIGSVQLSGRYWTPYCWSVFCGQVDVERPGFSGDGRVGYDMGHLQFAFSVSNLTNRAYRVYTDDTTATGGQITPVFAPPRWFRGSFTFKF